MRSRLAVRDEIDALRDLMDAAISELHKGFLDEAQIASSRVIMGIDTQLIKARGSSMRPVALLRMEKAIETAPN